MPQRRAPFLVFLLALAFVAYPVTMPLAMAVDSRSGASHGEMAGPRSHHPGGHHHAVPGCCVGVCACCPLLAVAGRPPIRVLARRQIVHLARPERPVSSVAWVLVRLPHSTGPPLLRA